VFIVVLEQRKPPELELTAPVLVLALETGDVVINELRRRGIYVAPTDATLTHAIFALALLNMSIAHTPMSGINLKAATVAAASTLANQTVANNVASAFSAVGIGQGCTAPPPVPTVNVVSEFCAGRNTINWTTTPGAKYHGELVRRPYLFDVADTVVDGTMNSCFQDVGGQSRFHLRACNGCGCSDWSIEQNLPYYPTCY
jgi:hypothetical protein